MSRVRIRITADDIRDGKPGDDNRCPVVLAQRRRFKSYQVIRVCGDEVFFARRTESPGVWQCLPETAVVFRSRFHQDGRDVVTPIEIELARPTC